MATEEEMEIAAELELQYYAHSRLLETNIQLDGSSYKELLRSSRSTKRKSMSFWRAIHKRCCAMGMVLTLNGPIYVSNGNSYYEEIDDEKIMNR